MFLKDDFTATLWSLRFSGFLVSGFPKKPVSLGEAWRPVQRWRKVVGMPAVEVGMEGWMTVENDEMSTSMVGFCEFVGWFLSFCLDG